MTNFFLSPGTVSAPLYAGQVYVQGVLLLVAFAMVPTLLCGVPYLEKKEHEKKLKYKLAAHVEGGSRSPAEGASGDEEGEDEHFDFSEVMIHQVIHTIEFVLGCVVQHGVVPPAMGPVAGPRRAQRGFLELRVHDDRRPRLRLRNYHVCWLRGVACGNARGVVVHGVAERVLALPPSPLGGVPNQVLHRRRNRLCAFRSRRNYATTILGSGVGMEEKKRKVGGT